MEIKKAAGRAPGIRAVVPLSNIGKNLVLTCSKCGNRRMCGIVIEGDVVLRADLIAGL